MKQRELKNKGEEEERLKKEKEKKEVEENKMRVDNLVKKVKEDRESAIKTMLENTKKVNKHPLYR